MTNPPHVSKNNIAAIREEFHDWNALEIEPGFTINDLNSREECNRAQLVVQGQINSIIQQIANAKLLHAKGKAQIDHGWEVRAQSAIRWKRRLVTAIHAKRQGFPKPPSPPHSVYASRQGAILDVAEEMVGREAVKKWVEIAKQRNPELFTKDAPVDKSNSGDNL